MVTQVMTNYLMMCFAGAYKMLYLKWNKECKAIEKKEKIEVLLQDKACLLTTISGLKEEVYHLKFQTRRYD